MSRTRIAALAAVGVAAVIGLTAALVIAGKDGDAAGEPAGPCRDSVSTMVPQPTGAQLAAAGLARLPLASDDARVDLVAPPFSNPTGVSNPLFPIGNLRSALLNGTVDGEAFRTETTLLPETRIMEWSKGQCVEVLVSQYAAYLGGRIHEVALDLYAQADDGSVWYLGEDVFNYEGGVVADTAGTWFAGIDGPAAMIMPGDPRVGDAFRPENTAGLVFEEVTVEAVGQTVAGPRGPVRGAITTRELHDDGTTEEKTFAPGYGEFFTASGGDVEALVLAVPTDALPGGVPPALEKLASGAEDVFVAAERRLWSQASRTISRMSEAWATHRRVGAVPPRLVAPMNGALKDLARRVGDRDRLGSRQAALDVAQAGLDLRLQYLPPAEIDLRRFDLWLRQVVVDADAGAHGALLGDVATLEWIRDRIEKALDPDGLTRLDTLLKKLRSNAGDEDFEAASETAAQLRELVA